VSPISGIRQITVGEMPRDRGQVSKRDEGKLFEEVRLTRDAAELHSQYRKDQSLLPICKRKPTQFDNAVNWNAR
jgi:hypothetical protein